MSARLVRAAAITAVLALVLVACSSTSDPEDPTVADPGYAAGDGTFTFWAPDERSEAVEITGTTFDREELALADWRGDVVVLNFWYANCPPCRAEAPDLASISQDYAGSVHLLGVNGTDEADRVAAFNATFGITYPSLDDADARTVAALEGLVPLRAMPTTVVLDAQGRPAARIVGLAEGTTLRGLIDDVLAEEA